MQPNRKVTRAHLGMDDLAFGSAVNAARCEAQGVHEKVMLRGDILAHEKGNEPFDFGHIW